MPLSISGTPVTTATQNSSYDGFVVTGSGGTAPLTYSISSGALPTGVTINSVTGLVSGTPTVSGAFSSIVIRVTDSVSATADLASFTLTVAADTAFKPLDLGSKLIACWDAESGVTYGDVGTNGGAVSAWADTQGGLSPAQATAGNKPTYQPNGFNGYRPAVSFDGTDDYLRIGSTTGLPSGATAAEIWALVEQSALAADTTARVIIAHGGGSATNRRDIRRGVNAGVNRGIGNSATGSTETTNRNDTVDFSGMAVVRYQATGTTHIQDVNGTAGSSTSVTPNTGTSNTTIGANTSSTPAQLWNGKISSIVYTTNTLTTPEADDLYAWLNARKATLTFQALTLDGSGRDTFSSYQWNVNQDAGASWAIQDGVGVVTDYKRFEVRAADNWSGDPSSPQTRNRAELQNLTRFLYGVDIWQSHQFKIEAGSTNTASSCVIGQWHNTPDASDESGLSPPFAIEFQPTTEKLLVRKRYSSASPTTIASVTGTAVYTSSSALNRDQWYHLVTHTKWGFSNDATIEVWLDGAKIVDLTSTNLGYNDAVGPYWKFGIYRGVASETLAVHYANMELGYTSLAARIGNPRPVV